MLPIKRKNSSKRRSKKQITSLLRKDPFDDRIDYTDLNTIASLAKLDPKNALIQIECAKSLAPFEFAQAKKCFEKAIALEPKNASFCFQYAEALRAHRYNRSMTQKFYDEAYKIEPSNADHILGHMRKFPQEYWHSDNRDKREKLVAKALSVDSNHPQANYHAAKLLIRYRGWNGLMTYSENVMTYSRLFFLNIYLRFKRLFHMRSSRSKMLPHFQNQKKL